VVQHLGANEDRSSGERAEVEGIARPGIDVLGAGWSFDRHRGAVGTVDQAVDPDLADLTAQALHQCGGELVGHRPGERHALELGREEEPFGCAHVDHQVAKG
jgi:hypothetical protein